MSKMCMLFKRVRIIICYRRINYSNVHHRYRVTDNGLLLIFIFGRRGNIIYLPNTIFYERESRVRIVSLR